MTQTGCQVVAGRAIHVDYLQNIQGKTRVCACSARACACAGVDLLSAIDRPKT